MQQYWLIATPKRGGDVQTRSIDAANDAEAIEAARLWKAGMLDGFHTLVQAAVALPGGEVGTVIGTAE